jgi:hypothetical protein
MHNEDVIRAEKEECKCLGGQVIVVVQRRSLLIRMTTTTCKLDRPRRMFLRRLGQSCAERRRGGQDDRGVEDVVIGRRWLGA